MAIKNYEEAARQIIRLSGGEDNFVRVENCATRVRVQYKDVSKVDLDGIRAIDGVLSVLEQGAVQIVVGPGACNKLCEALNKLMTLTAAGGVKKLRQRRTVR